MGQIIVNLDVELAKRKMSLSELADRVGLTLDSEDGQGQGGALYDA